jgi:hypothetical protein
MSNVEDDLLTRDTQLLQRIDMLHIPLISAVEFIATCHTETCHAAWQSLRVVQNYSVKQLAAQFDGSMAVQQ